ncbi:hypothetical protein C7444_11277 [Sphaerotilus hippei]|uniref:Transmembrane protein n=1 Tax=Sphaerotilus hippei TaxID=744406 RepID=A0A318GY35_9BURK|nr:hypothetical protein [Sphaerotilus hippei]PXW94761.1 hypothetical protein C7444_11277 [Sphaerotilus hippei]
MYLVAIAWMYVAVMMSAAELMHPDGSVLGAVVTLLLYGVGPLALVLYLLRTPARRRARKAQEAAEQAQRDLEAAAGPVPAPPSAESRT